MSDEEIDVPSSPGSENADVSEETLANKVSFSDRLVKPLIYISIGIVALILSATVSFLTYRFMDRGNRSRAFSTLSEEYKTVIPVYEGWSFLRDDGFDLRTQTADSDPYILTAKIKLGYDGTLYKELKNELTLKNDALVDMIRFYFSQRFKSQLEDENTVKVELLNRINGLLSRGEIAQIWFLQYQIIGL